AALGGAGVCTRAPAPFGAGREGVQSVSVGAWEDQEVSRRRYGANLAFMNVRIADGGAERFESIANALPLVAEDAEFIAIHDAVRPCVTEALIDAVFARAAQTGAALLALPVSDTAQQVAPHHQ